MKLLKLLLLVFLSNQLTAQCVQNEMIYNFENSIDPWQSTNTYSFGQSGTSFESSKSVFVKASFDQNNQQARAGSSTNFNNATQQWGNSQGIKFDFIFVNVANEGTTADKPAARPAETRIVYLELTDQSGKKIKHNFTDSNNSWHQRKALWNDFTGDSNFNKNAVTSIGFYTDRNNQNYTEVFRFDDIELLCDENAEPMPTCFENEIVYNFENNIDPWQSTNTYSFGQSGTSFESSKSVFVKASFDQSNQQTRAGASSNFNNNIQQWSDYKGIQFDFVFVNVANDGTATGKPAARTSGSRMAYLELTDQNGNKIKHNFTDYNNSWHQRKALWSEFSGASNFNKNAITSIGFYTDRNNQNYTEVFRFDDIELFCEGNPVQPDSPNQSGAILLSDVAKNFTKPKGAPNYSDVCLTSRYRRFKSHSKFPVSTEEAVDDFHPTRLDWVYVTEQSYIKDIIIPKGLKFSATLNTQLPDNMSGPRTYNNGRCIKQNGTKFKLPWLNFGDGIEQYSGSVNEPAYRSIFMDHARLFYQDIDPNHLAAVQMDDSGFSYRIALDFGGCYGSGDQQKAQSLGYNIYTQQNAFQKKSTELFYDDMLNQIRTESGNNNIGFSMNNDGHHFTDRVMASSFDFAMGELYNERATPVELYRVSQQAKNLGKMQIFSPVRYVTSGDGTYMYDVNGNNTAHTNINRKCIATAYAIGTTHFVPWDTWFYGSTRHFGLAKNYADLFAMVRAVPHYLDGYEDAALFSPNGSLAENRYNGALPVKVNANNNVWAFARAKPNNAAAPVVIHLVNWANNATNATVEIINKHISADGTFTAKLITPKTYNAAAHQLANQQAANMLNGLRGSYQSSAYENLIDVKQISTNNVNQNKTTLNLTGLNTWSILILEPSATPACDDSDGDGVCNADDVCANGDDNEDQDRDGTPDACDNCNNNLTGNACNDNKACTTGETYDSNCNCTGGVLQDTDGDNVCDANDICANGNDYIDDDLDGTPNACDICPNDSTNSCEIPSYCTSKGNDVSFEYIANVTVGDLRNNSGSDGGYKDFTNISESLITGTSANVSLTPGYSGTSYPEKWKIWIDFNQDGDFGDAGEEVFSDAGNGTISGSIAIPTNAILGATGMRVTMQWSVNDSPKPCGSFDYGEVEDYTVILVESQGRISSLTNISGNSFKVHPNPAKEFINIYLPNVISNMDNYKTVKVSVFSTNGKLIIRKEKSSDDVIKMNIGDLPNNKFYFIKISTEGNIKFSTKFLKL